jgi:hypothetical protein
VIAQAVVPPYAVPGAKAQTAQVQPTAPKPASIAAPASSPPPIAAPAPTPTSTSIAPKPLQPKALTAAPTQPQMSGIQPNGGYRSATTQTQNGQQGNRNWQQDGRRDRRDDNSFRSLPFGLGAALGVAGAAVVQPGYGQVYGQPGYGVPVVQGGYPVDPAYSGDVYGNDPYAAPPAYQGGPYEPGYRAEDARDPGFAPGRAQAVPAESRPRDPETAGRQITFGTETLDAQDVMATIAAARVVGVTPAALLAMQSRSLEAVEAVRQQAGEDNPNMPIDGPYGYSIERWQSALSRFGSSVGIGGALAKVTGGPSNDAETDRAAAVTLRGDAYISGLMAAAEMASNDMAYRQAFGAGPMLAELVIGHHAGQKAMLQLSQIYRQAPGTPMGQVVRENFMRDLVMLTGMAHVPPPQGQWTVGAFIQGVDNALKNSLTRYAAADRMQLPVDYKPQARAMARAADDGYAPRPGMGRY